ncbi:MAG: hypothetical protein HPY55_08800 [Firmicutes bacterium]|nr:hypothetical protein [Bacillota bacterium]
MVFRVRQVIDIMEQAHLGTPGLGQARGLIESQKLSVMDDEKGFVDLIDRVTDVLIDEVDRPFPHRTEP